jgi:hypothetical protein
MVGERSGRSGRARFKGHMGLTVAIVAQVIPQLPPQSENPQQFAPNVGG